MHETTTLGTFCCSVLFTFGESRAQPSIVVPAAQATSSGTTTGGAPFGYTNYVRHQQAIGTSHFPGPVTIYGISFRSQTTWPNTPEIQSQGLLVQLSDCQKPANALDGTFANNVGPVVKTVFNSTVTVLRQNLGSPLEFSVLLPFDKPYLHLNTAPLLVDLVPTSLGALPCGKGGNGTACDFVATDPDMSWVYGKGTCAVPPLVQTSAGPGGFVIKFWTSNVLMPFGRACAGTSVPQISSTGNPTPGNAAFSIQLAQAPAGTPPIATLLLGASNTLWGATALPIELSSLSMPTCFLAVAPDVALTTGVAAGAASHTLPIPNAPGLLGQSLFAQWLSIADGANPLGVVASQAGQVVIR
jgi:hypothetical protein